MTTFFVSVDICRNKLKHTGIWDYKFGQFFIAGSCSALGFALSWPLEVLKNLSQAGNNSIGDNMS